MGGRLGLGYRLVWRGEVEVKLIPVSILAALSVWICCLGCRTWLLEPLLDPESLQIWRMGYSSITYYPACRHAARLNMTEVVH